MEKSNTTLIIGIGITIALVVLSFGSVKAKEEKTDNSSFPISSIRAIRNNNPGNLIISPNNWTGKIPTTQNTDGVFEQFYEKKYGTRAMIKLLNNYIQKFSRNTIDKIVRAWSQTDQETYIQFIVDSITYEIGKDDAIDPNWSIYKNVLRDISKAIAHYEAGKENLTDAEFEEAYGLL